MYVQVHVFGLLKTCICVYTTETYYVVVLFKVGDFSDNKKHAIFKSENHFKNLTIKKGKICPISLCAVTKPWSRYY